MVSTNIFQVFLGFGGNLDDPLHHFRYAKQQLMTHPQIDLVATSPLYQTPPVGGPAGQPDYVNGVLEIRTGLSAPNLLQLCRQLEDSAGRVRDQHWGARTLDIDLLLFAGQRLETPRLTLPHPRLQQRHFVLLPLNDLAPQLVHPTLQKTISKLLSELPPAVGIGRLEETW